MNKTFMTMVAITAMASMLSMNAFAQTSTSEKSYLISGVPLDQVDQSYKSLKLDSSKTSYIIYMDSNLSVQHTVGKSYVDDSTYQGLVVNGNCLNMYNLDNSESNGCFNQFSPVVADFDETQSGNFLILQEK